jgi:hypothetical protein
MGRPLKKDVLGTNVLGTYVSDAGVKVEFYDSELRSDGVLLKQRGARTFVTTRVGDIGTTSTYVTAKLVSTEPAAYGEMRILGSTNGLIPGTVAIAKITKRVATDFTGKRYTWYLENDSSADVIVLTAL